MNDTAPPRRDLAEVLLALGACNETPDDAVPWARPYGADWERALEACPQRAWIFWLAGALIERGHLKRAILVTAACVCARSVLHLVPAGEKRPGRAVEAAERWTRGEATKEEVRAAREAAISARQAAWLSAASVAPWAVAAAADACAAPASGSDEAYWVGCAADAASSAASSAVWADWAANSSAAADWAAADRAAKSADAATSTLVKRELGPALLEGLTAYAATLPAMETAK